MNFRHCFLEIAALNDSQKFPKNEEKFQKNAMQSKNVLCVTKMCFTKTCFTRKAGPASKTVKFLQQGGPR